jgi:hypothetical protein
VATETLANLKIRAKERSDFTNSDVIAPSTWVAWINESLSELFDLLTQAYGEEYFSTSTTISTTAGTYEYSLPSNFYKLLGVDRVLTATDSRAVPRMQFSDRNKKTAGLGYFLFKDKIVLRGNVPNGTLKLWYIPTLTKLSADGDTFDFVNGWEEFVVVDVAMKAVMWEEGDPSALVAQRINLVKRISAASANRDASESFSIIIRDESDIDEDIRRL